MRHMQLRVRGEAEARSSDRPSTHPLLEACTVSAQSARQRRLLCQASVLLPQLAHLRVLPGRRPAQLLDLGHLRTTCSPSHAASEANRRSLARMPRICAAIQLSAVPSSDRGPCYYRHKWRICRDCLQNKALQPPHSEDLHKVLSWSRSTQCKTARPQCKDTERSVPMTAS